ncbi:MAG: hypothetical protein DMG88_04680 [Acidobacteria bacterium]|nr:MAG: hypothetical protein DMG88_04680 [Acidobacteriota bacterium]
MLWRSARTDYLISSGCSSLKLSADSAGSTMFLLPVKAEPAPPAPAPAIAPIAAPLPPPAKPPISAPTPAPPPVITAVRFPLPFSARVTDEVSIGWSLPLMLMEVSFSLSNAPPLKRPSGLASTTVPVALVSAGITVLPATSTGLVTVAEKLCPASLIFDPTACPSRTVIIVPAGMTTDFAGSGFAFAAFPAFSGAALSPVEFEGDSGDLLQPNTANDK